MSLIVITLLRGLHYVHYVRLLWQSLRQQVIWAAPQPLIALRHRVPRHLAVVLVADATWSETETESCLLQSVKNAVEWCRAAGIQKLTVYEEHGKLFKFSWNIRDMLDDASNGYPCKLLWNKDPMKPLESNHDWSRSMSPSFHPPLDMHTVVFVTGVFNEKMKPGQPIPQQEREFSICLASRKSSKPAIASIADWLKEQHKRAVCPKTGEFTLTCDTLGSLLESEDILSAPDSLIVHPLNPLSYNWTPTELHGYPPWQIRLTEICHNRVLFPWSMLILTRGAPVPFDELTFRRALDEYAAAEMRFGK
ncbi:putative dolichol biosynthetic process [Lyophyllum shimeji]|uniref:ditrans,polycis-polyprenyl diphosphate synthase [(2E,6E)-farnesyldiphosphate specific] n=1 Tax=Lyophyllum shimeji TaxID=47721 RepID=A0A9P3PW20_LYOSH|nr:putative dolichol biosynthetic process [Lyophyllum shimeji]